MTEQQLAEEIAQDLDRPIEQVAPVVHEVLARVHGDEDSDRGHIPLTSLPLTGGAGEGWPVGTRGEAAGQ